jgi:hypothetical protein
MISCQTFRSTLRPGTSDAQSLEHLRQCDACLEFALSVDPDFFFRSLGGEDLLPPGGVEAFTADVMAQIHLRHAESSVERRVVARMPRRLAAVAALVFILSGGTLLFQQWQKQGPVAPELTARAVQPRLLATKPVVETYQSQHATIVEVPTEGNDPKIVMIFDESLPADL